MESDIIQAYVIKVTSYGHQEALAQYEKHASPIYLQIFINLILFQKIKTSNNKKNLV